MNLFLERKNYYAFVVGKKNSWIIKEAIVLNLFDIYFKRLRNIQYKELEFKVRYFQYQFVNFVKCDQYKR